MPGRRPARVAIDCGGEVTTYAELDARSDALAAGLLEAGLAPGDRVATLTATSPEHVVVFFACAKVGLILMPLNTRLAAPELRYQLEDAEPSVLLCSPEFAELGASLHERTAPLEALQQSVAKSLPEPEDDDGLLLVYTSGTTGKPKGALLTHANCFWTNLSFDRVAGAQCRGHGAAGAAAVPLSAAGTSSRCWRGGRARQSCSSPPSIRLARSQLIAEKRVTTMMGVPATYLFMAQDPGFANADLWTLRRAVVGGAPMPEALLETWHERGVEIVQGYGLTEAAPNVLCLPPEDAARKRGFAGKPYPHVDVALRDTESGRLLDGATEGELLVRGPNVFAGYWRNTEATDAAFADGWLVTGDVAARDDEGYYRIVGRTKDMVISGGENVYPAEIENVLHEHPAVKEAAVVGVPDERWGEACLAFVVRDGDATEDELLEHCRGRLARYKVPKGFRFVDSLPRNALDKVVKSELLELAR